MGTHIKTTIDIADTLLRRAKKVASAEHITLRELTEEGLELALERRKSKAARSMKLVTFGDRKDVAPDLNWDTIRDLVYPS